MQRTRGTHFPELRTRRQRSNARDRPVTYICLPLCGQPLSWFGGEKAKNDENKIRKITTTISGAASVPALSNNGPASSSAADITAAAAGSVHLRADGRSIPCQAHITHCIILNIVFSFLCGIRGSVASTDPLELISPLGSLPDSKLSISSCFRYSSFYVR